MFRIMWLGDYLKKTGETRTAFARRVGCDRTTIGRILNRKERPLWRLMEAIERETNGEVLPNDFRLPKPEGSADGGVGRRAEGSACGM